MTKEELEKRVLELEQRLLNLINGNIKIMARLEAIEDDILKVKDKNLSHTIDIIKIIEAINKINNTSKTNNR